MNQSTPGSPPIHLRSNLARILYNKIQTDAQNLRADRSHWYRINARFVDEFCPSLREAKFVQLDEDSETRQFLTNCTDKSNWLFTELFHSISKSLLTWFISSTSANGLLNRGSMFVISSNQFEQLVRAAQSALSKTTGSQSNGSISKNDCDDSQSDALHFGSLLDLGAGDGKVTEKLAKFFGRVFATELSRPMRWRLEKLGFELLDADKWHLGQSQHNESAAVNQSESTANEDSKKFDMIACLNLLDRCDQPITMLRQIRSALKPKSGLLLLAIKFPWRQHVEYKKGSHSASETIILDAAPPRSTNRGNNNNEQQDEGGNWEFELEQLVAKVIQPVGFQLLCWSRLPYLCEGDLSFSFFYLNDAVLLLRPV